MSRTWGRLYAGTRNHRKVKILAQRLPSLWTFWYVLIDLAIEVDDGGWIYVSPDTPYTFQELAKELRIRREDHVKTLCKTLEELKMVTISDKGILLNSYLERNFDSDSSTPRVQKYREKQKQEKTDETDMKRFSNVSVTDQNRTETEHIQNRTEQSIKTPRKSKKIETIIPDDFAISEAVKTWAAGKGFSRLEDHLEAFKDYALSRGKTYADWDSAFKRAIREDWAKLRSGNGQGQRSPALPMNKADAVTLGNLQARDRLLKKYQEQGE